MEVEIGEKLNENQINFMLKKLYETNFFSDVNIKYENQILYIKVVENPIVQNIIIEGVKANKLKDQIYDYLLIK